LQKAQPLDELQPSLLLRPGFRAISSMDQLGDSHDGDADFDLALNRLQLFQNFSNGTSPAFGCDNNA